MSIDELCKSLNVSDSTARRVMTSLADKGMIIRYHGGGHSVEWALESSDIQKRFDLHASAKDAIARTAAELVKPDSIIILMGGTTVCKMCKYIKDMKVTVITNSIIILDELKNRRGIDIVLLGGRYNHSEMEVVGALTDINLKMLRADSLFMGANHFHPKIGFLTDERESLQFYRNCIDAASKSYVLADSSKLGENAAAITATCDMVDCLITDNKLDIDIIKQFESMGVSVIYKATDNK